jgi:hypothetical protein
LLDAHGIEGRVAVPVDQIERPLGIDRLGLAVAHEQDLGRARRGRVAMLAVRVGLALRLAHAPPVALPSSGFAAPVGEAAGRREAQEYGARKVDS